MKDYEVIITEQIGRKMRVVHKEFDEFDVALEYASSTCLNDDDFSIVACSIYRKNCLIMDVL